MKYKTLFVLASTFILATSCGEKHPIPDVVNLDVKPISLTASIHSEVQYNFLHNDGIAEYIENNSDLFGKDSKSKPIPITFSWEENNSLDQPATNYRLTISESSDLSNPLVYTTTVNSIDIYNLKILTKYYYQISSNHFGTYFNSEISDFSIGDDAPRNIYVDGVENCRDLGGWNIGNERIYKQGMIYRTAQFNYGGLVNKYECAPTQKGKDTLINELKIKTDIDLRRNIAFDDYDEVNGITSSPLGVKYVAAPMIYGNSNIFTRAKNIPSIQLFFNTLADASNYPIAFHCMRGTDRTGALAYVLGALVGMNEKDLMLDYLFSDLANIGNPVKASIINADDFFIKGIANSEGSTLSEKTMNYLYTTCNIARSTLESIIDILTEE